MLTGDYAAIVHQIVDKDKRQFEKQHADYTHDPMKVSQFVLDLIFTEDRWREHWDDFLIHMVYEKDKPSFDKAYGCLQKISQAIFNEKSDGNKHSMEGGGVERDVVAS